MGIKSVILRLKGELKSKLTKIKHMEKDKFKTLYRAHAKMYWNLYESRLVEKALNVGDRIPIESLRTYLGEEVNIPETLKKGPLVLAFFRGTWCGYCSTEVNYLQENLKNFEDLGATVVAISPQNVEHSKSMVEHQGITYPVVSDNNNLVAKQFGLTYLLTDEVVEALKESYQVDVRKFYAKDVVEVPLPATYVIDSNGVIVYAFIEEDHRKRADIGEVLLAINRCRINKKTYFQKAQQCDQLTMCLVKKMMKKCNQELVAAGKAKAKAKDRRNSDVSRISITTTALFYCLENEEYLNSFKDFLAKTYCSENLLFYFDSRDYFENYNKKDINERKTSANTIFENYIKPSSELEVNIDDGTREQITINVKQENYIRDLFESANSEVFKMLETDSFHKWRRTKEFDSVWRRNGSPALLAVSPF